MVQIAPRLRWQVQEDRDDRLPSLDAEVEAKGEEGEVTLSFSFHGPALDQAIADLGTPPLPPYIASKRTPDEQDATLCDDVTDGRSFPEI